MLKLLARPMVADVLRVLRGQRLWQLKVDHFGYIFCGGLLLCPGSLGSVCKERRKLKIRRSLHRAVVYGSVPPTYEFTFF